MSEKHEVTQLRQRVDRKIMIAGYRLGKNDDAQIACIAKHKILCKKTA